MNPESLTVEAHIDRETFIRFALFDALVRKKGLRGPLLFALILSAFAAVCFAARATHAQAALLGGVLLGVGLSLPLVWLGMFLSSVVKQARRSGLSPERAQYTVALAPEAIHVTKGAEAADFRWEDVHMAYRARGCVYLYVSPTRAFLLPESGGGGPVWALLTERLEPARLRRLTR